MQYVIAVDNKHLLFVGAFKNLKLLHYFHSMSKYPELSLTTIWGDDYKGHQLKHSKVGYVNSKKLFEM